MPLTENGQILLGCQSINYGVGSNRVEANNLRLKDGEIVKSQAHRVKLKGKEILFYWWIESIRDVSIP